MSFSDSVREVRIHYIDHHEKINWEYSDLAAPYWRLYWNRSGRSAMTFSGGYQVPFENRTIYVIPPETPFGCSTEESINHFHIHYTFRGFSPSQSTNLYDFGKEHSLYSILETLIENLVDLFDHRKSSDADMVSLAAGLIFLIHSNIPVDQRSARGEDRLVDQVVHAIDSGHPECLTGIACSERTLRRRFQAVMGMTPREYEMQLRIEKACLLLHFSEKTIEEVAGETGFLDRYHFTRVFSGARGMGPAQYRNVMTRVYPEGFIPSHR